ncbi:MAG: prephenate/arogenate dehydrogenase family protein [Pseudomonadota bacterium]
MAEPVFEKLTIIGCGLIGSSIALATRDSGAAKRIAIFDRDAAVRDAARTLGLGDIEDSADQACADTDCLIICTPVGALGDALTACAPALKAGAIVTDVGSVKGGAIAAMTSATPSQVHLIPGHPIAGTEHSGPEAGFATLFQDAWHILTPLDKSGPAYSSAVERLAAFWTRLGARVETMPADRHDRVLAITSHLPHLIAFNIVATAYDMQSVEDGDVVKYSAGGFRDFTRIAASDPIMWRDVFLSNKDAVLEALGRFSEDLAALQRAIRWGDGETLIKEFERARGIRQAIIEAGMDSAEANFGRNKPEPPETD